MGLGHRDGGLLVERVGGELGRFGVDVDRVAVGLRGPDALIDPRRERGALHGVLGIGRAERGVQGAVKVHVDPLVAGRRRVGDVGGERIMAL
jgi:hypothetical protein